MKRIIIGAILLAGLLTLLIIFYKSEPATPQEPLENLWPEHEVIGRSVEGRAIDAYTYGDGETHLLFVGGIHGGYEWNTVVLAYEFKDYLDADSSVVPKNLTVTVIPSLNPDGVYKVVGKEGRFSPADVPVGVATASGRFNANEVDLNRNFDCKWQPQSVWRNNPVKAGTAPFSEPEALAFRNFVLENDPRAVIFWHSQSDAVYASQCLGGILPETKEIMNLYAKAAGYAAIESFDAYETTGDAEAWLASIGIPAITVELKTHEAVEWEQNLAGIKSLFNYYSLKGL
jgi:predicted deacylase